MTKKETIFAILFFGLVLFVSGQDTTFYDRNWKRIASIDSIYYYTIYEHDSDSINKATERNYFKSGQIQSEINYSNFHTKKIDGKRKEWYENGQLKKDIDFQNDLFNGELLVYWEDGKLKRHDTYKKGKFISGKCYDKSGTKIKHYDYSMIPEFVGGLEGLYYYLQQTIEYPEAAHKKGIQGIVYITFFVDTAGNIFDSKIAKGVDELLDKEALRVVSKMPPWTPGREDNEKVIAKFNLPIRFTSVNAHK